MKNNINYIVGDATKPQGEGNKIIAHINNTLGKWGKGFVLAVSRRWEAPEVMYKKWYAGTRRECDTEFGLGKIQIVKAESGIWVANMVAQDGIYVRKGEPPIRYSAVEGCLKTLVVAAKDMSASVHMPRIGCGLAGGEWHLIEAIINNTLIENDIPVFVYDLR